MKVISPLQGPTGAGFRPSAIVMTGVSMESTGEKSVCVRRGAGGLVSARIVVAEVSSHRDLNIRIP